MYHSSFVNLDVAGLKNYKFEPMQCVYGALVDRYGFNEDELLKLFQDYKNSFYLDGKQQVLKKEDGVNTEMLLYLAKIKQFSLYALDVNKKLFSKYISKNRRYMKAFVYVCHNNHLYLIDDITEIKKITQRNKDKKSNKNEN